MLSSEPQQLQISALGLLLGRSFCYCNTIQNSAMTCTLEAHRIFFSSLVIILCAKIRSLRPLCKLLEATLWRVCRRVCKVRLDIINEKCGRQVALSWARVQGTSGAMKTVILILTP